MNQEQIELLQHKQELQPFTAERQLYAQQQQQNPFSRNEVQIIDCYQEITKSNYLPFILAITEHKLQNINGLDESGYNALHYAASQGSTVMAKILVEELDLEPTFQSKNNQTPLMIALNIGCNELVDYFLKYMPTDQLHIKDSCGFTYLIYAAKSSQIPFFLYFFNEGIDINSRDNSGCTVMHWAAYQNHLEMLKIIERLTGNLNIQDQQNFTPLMRAEENCSFKTAKYIKSKLNPQKCFYSKAPLLFSIITYLFLSVFSYYQFYYYFQDNSSYFGTLFTLLFIYFQIIFLYFILNGKSTQKKNSSLFTPLQEFNSEILQQATKEGFPEIDPEMLKSIDFTKLNSALGIKSSSNYNYMHYTICYIKQKLFKQLNNFDFSRYCPTCLKYMPPQTHHCRQTDQCIEHYSHYSQFFGRVINNENHLLFYSILGLQQILMILFIYCSMYSFRKQRTSYYLVSYFETCYLNYMKNGIWNCFAFILISYLLAINSYYFILETWGIFINQTRNEIFNRYKYRYFYKTVTNQKNIIWNYYTNAQSQGYEQNIRNYLGKASQK